MALKGDLGSIDLAHVFQMLSMSDKTGILDITADGAGIRLFFDPQGVVLLTDETSFVQKVGDLLVSRRELTADLLAQVQNLAEQHQLDPLQAMVREEYLTSNQVVQAWTQKMEEDIYDLFLSKEISFEFLEGEKPDVLPGPLGQVARLSANALIMEAARRMDEWEFVKARLSAADGVYEVIGSLEELPPEDADYPFEEILGYVDGSRTVSDVIRVTGYSRYLVCGALARCVEHGVVEEVSAEDLVKRAMALLDESHDRRGLVLLEAAIDKGVDDPKILRFAAELNEKQDQLRRASRLWDQVADHLEANNKRDEALQVWLNVRKTVCTNLEARLKLVRLYQDSPAGFPPEYKVLDEGEALAWMLQSVGRDEDARQVLRVLHESALDPRTAQRLSQVACEMGAPRTAVEILAGSASEAVRLRSYSQAMRLYHRIRTIDPSHDGLERRIQECQKAAERSRPKSLRFVRTAILLLISTGVGTAYLTYNSRALDEFKGLGIEGLAVDGEFQTALRSLRLLREEYPGTVSWWIAAEQIQALEDRANSFYERNEQEEATLRKELAVNQVRAERHWARAEKAMHEGDYPTALEAMQEAAENATDERWRRRENLDEKIEEISQYLDGARDLYQDWLLALEAREWSDAHALALRLKQEYPLAPLSHQAWLPVEIRTHPPEATIVWTATGGHKPQYGKDTAPVVMEMQPSLTYEVEFEAPNHFPVKLIIDPTRESRYFVRMAVEPTHTADLGASPVASPTVADDRIVVPCEDGRLVVLDRTTGEVIWRTTLPDLQEVQRRPTVAGGDLWVAGSKSSLLRYRLSDGELLRNYPLPASVTQPICVAEDRVLVAMEAGEPDATQLLSLLASSGQEVWSVRHSATLSVELLMVGDRLLLGDTTGTVTHRSIETGRLVERWKVPSAVTRVAVAGTAVFVGCADGLLTAFEVARPQPVWTKVVGNGFAVAGLKLRPESVLVMAGEELFLLRRQDGAVLAHRPDARARSLEAGAAGEVLLVTSAGAVHVLEDGDLAVQVRAQAQQRIHQGVMGEGQAILLGNQGAVYVLSVD